MDSIKSQKIKAAISLLQGIQTFNLAWYVLPLTEQVYNLRAMLKKTLVLMPKIEALKGVYYENMVEDVDYMTQPKGIKTLEALSALLEQGDNLVSVDTGNHMEHILRSEGILKTDFLDKIKEEDTGDDWYNHPPAAIDKSVWLLEDLLNKYPSLPKQLKEDIAARIKIVNEIKQGWTYIKKFQEMKSKINGLSNYLQEEVLKIGGDK